MTTSANGRRGTINWLTIRTAYVVKGWSAKDCAAEFHVDVTTIKKRASKEKWTDERHRNATAGAEVVAEELRDAVVLELREHAKRVERALRLGDALVEKLESALAAVPVGDARALRTVVEQFSRYMDALSRGVNADRLVRGVRDGAPSDAGAADDGKPTMIEFRIVDGPRDEVRHPD